MADHTKLMNDETWISYDLAFITNIFYILIAACI
jgi:hypothetical protein